MRYRLIILVQGQNISVKRLNKLLVLSAFMAVLKYLSSQKAIREQRYLADHFQVR